MTIAKYACLACGTAVVVYLATFLLFMHLFAVPTYSTPAYTEPFATEIQSAPQNVQDACLYHKGRMVAAVAECVQDWRDGIWR